MANFERLFDILDFQAEQHPLETAICWQSTTVHLRYSTEQLQYMVNQVSAWLLAKKFEPGDTICLLFKHGHPWWNCLEWGAQQIGGITVSMHLTTTPEEQITILEQTEARFLFTCGWQVERIVQLEFPNLRTFHLDDQTTTAFERIFDNVSIDLTKITQAKAAVKPEDDAAIIFTSGTEGEPRGVVLTHSNIVSNIKSVLVLLPIRPGQQVMSFLPLSHVFERMVVHVYVAVGAALHFVEINEQLAHRFREIKPLYFTAVPRLLQTMYDRLQQTAQERGRTGIFLFEWAIRLAETPREQRNFWQHTQLLFAWLLVFRPWRKMLGGKLKGVVVGAAALPPRLGRIFAAARIRLREGYGLTEASPVVSFNRFEPGGHHLGTVGIPIPGVEIKIDSPNEDGEGEIYVRGPNIMKGYLAQPDLTNAVLLKDGWLKTGDIGKWIDGRFLKLTDRRGDRFKSSTGKFIAPQQLENHFKQSIYIDEMLILGRNEPFLGAIIHPEFRNLQQWCARNKVHWTSPRYMIYNPMVEQLYAKEITQFNQMLPKHKRIEKWTIVHEPWDIESGLRSITFKLRRNALAERYRKEIEQLFV